MNDKRISIHYFTFSHEAHMAKNILVAEGIEADVSDELVSQYNAFGHAAGGIKLNVPENDVAEAVEVLKKGGWLVENTKPEKQEIPEIVIHSEAEKEKCPFCGSDNIAEFKKPSILTVIFALVLRFIYPFFNKHYQCFDCEKQWRFFFNKSNK